MEAPKDTPAAAPENTKPKTAKQGEQSSLSFPSQWAIPRLE